MIIRGLMVFGACFLWAQTSVAQSQAATAFKSGKFELDQRTLLYETDDAVESETPEIDGDDVADLLAILEANPDIKSLVLDSGGGSIWAGEEIARIVIDYELDTHVSGECSSACVLIFLAGERRTMARGAKIGMHQYSWSPSGMQWYYKKWREDENWDTPFDFSSWVYEDTQNEVYEDLTYMIERGVDPAFAIESKRLRQGLWFPSRTELQDAGVLRD